MYFREGIVFGLGFAVAIIAVYMLWILLPDKPRVKKTKINNVRTGKWE